MVTPQDFLSVAQGIAARKSIPEIQARTAASRAYYAVFHLLVRELDIDFRLAAGGVHEIVRTELLARSSTESDVVRTAKLFFDSLRATRVKADYRLEESFSEMDLRVAIERAGRVFGALAD